MKPFLIQLIKHYQSFSRAFWQLHPLPIVYTQCRFYPTCSEYSIEAIEKHGPLSGGFKSLVRILRCNPFSKGGIDNA
ncbi:MAG: membrane protein insertion efficiency factor YidD [Candidatus Yanofskybacteria bacterium]|nr:membrane protein insertion efficiency factor YidD [Candidatus Yanofskybacteria bacterium]